MVVWALAAWLLVVIVGVRRVDRLARVLGVVVCTEIVVLLVFAVSNLLHPAEQTRVGRILSEADAPAGAGVQAVLVLAVLAFVGFEASVVFSAESRNPRRTVAAATYLALGVMALVYTLSSWALTVATGPDRIIAEAQAKPGSTVAPSVILVNG